MLLLSDFGQKCRFPFFLCPSLLQVGNPGGLSLILGSLELLSVPADFINYSFESVFKERLLQLAFLDDDDEPAFCLQLAPHFLIALLVPSNLCSPKVGIGFGYRVEFAAPVTMPEAAVDKNRRAVLGKDDIRSSGMVLVGDTVTEPQIPEGMTQL